MVHKLTWDAAEKLVAKCQKFGLLPKDLTLVEVLQHEFAGGEPDDFSIRGFGPTEHYYTCRLSDGRIVRLGDNSWPPLIWEADHA